MTGRVKKVWHGGCKQVCNGKATTEGEADQNKKRSNKMNGLIKQTNLDGVNFFGSLAIAFAGVAAALFVMANGLGGIA
jgi:hypothetical protein